MKTFKDYVQEIKEKQGVKSDYAVAKLLLIDPNKMSDILSGRRNPPAVARYTIADILGYDKTEVSACLDYWETKDPEAREYIKSVFLRHSRNVAALFLVVTMLSAAPNSNAFTGARYANGLTESPIMRTFGGFAANSHMRIPIGKSLMIGPRSKNCSNMSASLSILVSRSAG